MITEDYVSFETAKLLKEKGFDEICRAFWKDWNDERHLCDCGSSHVFEWCHNSMLGFYNDIEETNIAAPTLQMAMKWLREIHHIMIDVYYDDSDYNRWVSEYYDNNLRTYVWITASDIYEEAYEAAIKYCLENLI